MSSQIHDLGYRPYDGERAGVGWAVRSLVTHSTRQALGLKRAGKHKIAPGLTILFAFFPAVIQAAFSAILGGEMANELMGYGDYFGVVGFALILFTAAVAPGVLTPDRTTGMLALYLASPLTRTTYILSKGLGIFLVMLIVTTGPMVFLILAQTFVGGGPDGIVAFVELLARALAAGALTAAFFTGLGTFIASLPRRWSIASVAIVGTIFVTSAVAAMLTEETDVSRWVAVLGPLQVVEESWQRIFADPVDGPLLALDGRSSPVLLLISLGLSVALCAGTWWRYQQIDVER